MVPPKKKLSQKHQKNTFFRRILHFLQAVDICLHRRRTWGEVWGVSRNYWLIRCIRGIGRGIHLFFTKRGIWQAGKKRAVGFFTETVGEPCPPKNWFEKYHYVFWDGLMLMGVYIFLFSGLKLEWLFRDIIPIGGDVPFHVANYFDFKEILIPRFQISGWSDAGFAGLQLFQSYPVFPFILVYLLDLFMGSGVAFKIILILGATGLPIATYWTLWQSRIPRPGPIFGAILSLAYLFHDDHFAFGGNLRSVFSGEFAHSLSILFLVIFCGFLYKAFENKKYIPHAIITLALVGFSHPVSFAVAIFLPLGFILGKKIKEEETHWLPLSFSERSFRAFRIILIGGLLFCTWAIGYYANKKSMGNMDIIHGGYGWGITFHYLLPKLLLPFAVLFLAQLVYYCFQWRKLSQVQLIFLWGFLIALGFFFSRFMGFAIRFLPIIYLFVMLFLAATLGHIYHRSKREVVQIGLACLVIASATFIYYYVDTNNLFQRYRGTSGHNFIGAESRGEWKAVRLTSEFLSKNFDTQTEKPNTSYPPRIFSFFKGDLFRVTSKASIYDSLFSNSSFYSQGIWIGRRIDNAKISVKQFWNYMDLSNTKIVVGPKKLYEYIEKSPEYFRFLKTFDTYKVFETRNTSRSYVVPIRTEVYTINNLSEWKKTSKKWYQEYSEKSPFVVYDPDTTQTRFPLYNPKKSPKVLRQDDCQIRELVSRETIKIHTNCLNRPLLVKFAYHQNWQVTGADKVYLATPAFMIIVPNQSDVTLYYGKRPYNYLAYACGLLGLMLFFTYGYIETWMHNLTIKRYKKQKKLRAFFQHITRKYQLKKRSEQILIVSIPLLCTLILMLSIAFIYTNKRW